VILLMTCTVYCMATGNMWALAAVWLSIALDILLIINSNNEEEGD